MSDKGTDHIPFQFSVSSEVVDHYDLTPQQGWLYIVISRHIDRKTNEAFPSLSRLAKLTKMSRRTVINAMKGLEQRKLIYVVREKGDGKNQVNHYHRLPVGKPVLQLVDKLPIHVNIHAVSMVEKISQTSASGAPVENQCIETKLVHQGNCNIKDKRSLVSNDTNNPHKTGVEKSSKPQKTSKKKKQPEPWRWNYYEAGQSLLKAMGIVVATANDQSEARGVAKQINEAAMDKLPLDKLAGIVPFVRNLAEREGGWLVTLSSLTTKGRVSKYLDFLGVNGARDPQPGPITPPAPAPYDVEAIERTPEEEAEIAAILKANRPVLRGATD